MSTLRWIWWTTRILLQPIWWLTSRPFLWMSRIVLFPFRAIYGLFFGTTIRVADSTQRHSDQRYRPTQRKSERKREPDSGEFKFNENKTLKDFLRSANRRISDLMAQNSKVSKEVKQIKKDYNNIRQHLNQIMRHHMLQSYRNHIGQIICPMCTFEFNNQITHMRRPVKLNCIHIICFNCARAERFRQGQEPACPRCNVRFKLNQLQFIQL